jgi:hypothetical protein
MSYKAKQVINLLKDLDKHLQLNSKSTKFYPKTYFTIENAFLHPSQKKEENF